MMRPLVLINSDNESKIAYSIQTVGESLWYTLDRIKNGWMRQESINSEDMKVFIGRAANEMGREFEKKVSNRLFELGWTFTRENIELSSLGAPKKLGDVDVFAWTSNGNEMLVIECKRLRPARTVGEIGEQLNEFQGEAKDSLGRHLQRINWIQSNSKAVSRYFGLSTIKKFTPLLVTNTVVPMQFITGLPLNQEEILPFGSLETLRRP